MNLASRGDELIDLYHSLLNSVLRLSQALCSFLKAASYVLICFVHIVCVMKYLTVHVAYIPVPVLNECCKIVCERGNRIFNV